jgi:NACalpha-BTF3-like transcription factor
MKSHHLKQVVIYPILTQAAAAETAAKEAEEAISERDVQMVAWRMKMERAQKTLGNRETELAELRMIAERGRSAVERLAVRFINMLLL